MVTLSVNTQAWRCCSAPNTTQARRAGECGLSGGAGRSRGMPDSVCEPESDVRPGCTAGCLRSRVGGRVRVRQHRGDRERVARLGGRFRGGRVYSTLPPPKLMSPPVAPPTSRVREFLWRLLPISRGRETFASVRVLSAECRKRGFSCRWLPPASWDHARSSGVPELWGADGARQDVGSSSWVSSWLSSTVSWPWASRDSKTAMTRPWPVAEGAMRPSWPRKYAA